MERSSVWPDPSDERIPVPRIRSYRPTADTREQMGRLRALSTRATITPTRFCNLYTSGEALHRSRPPCGAWGDFKGDPLPLMEEYFDAFVYVTNWGTHELMLRLPRRLLSRAVADTYCMAESIRAKYKGDYIIITFRSEDEDAADIGEEDGDGWMSALSPLRAELASGDRRGLYLDWLASAQAVDLDDDALEPPVPSGLGALSTAQQMLASFLRLGPDLSTSRPRQAGRASLGIADRLGFLAHRRKRLHRPALVGPDLLLTYELDDLLVPLRVVQRTQARRRAAKEAAYAFVGAERQSRDADQLLGPRRREFLARAQLTPVVAKLLNVWHLVGLVCLP
jgi:hypothetical protein